VVDAVRRVTLTLALAALAAADGYGQEPPPAAAPARLAAPCTTPPGPEALPCPPLPTAGPVPGPAPPACAPYEDRNGPLLWGDPLLDQPGFPVPGWVAAVEVGAVLPVFRAGPFTFPVTVGGASVNVSPPLAGLDWTAAPKIDLGYRLGAGFGEFLVSYRFIVSEGSTTAPGFAPSGAVGGGPGTEGGGIGQVHSRLNFNVIDLVYASHESSLGPGWDMRWDAGVRLAGLYYDTRAVAPGLEQRASTSYLGGGAKGGLGLKRAIRSVPGLSLGGRVEAAYLLGQTRQHFEEVLTPAGGPAAGGADGFHAGVAVAVGALEASISYAPGWQCGRSRIETGYRYEKWWSIGEAFLNRGDLELQTLFVRWTYNY
jgi:hypothetical protein